MQYLKKGEWGGKATGVCVCVRFYHGVSASVGVEGEGVEGSGEGEGKAGLLSYRERQMNCTNRTYTSLSTLAGNISERH